MKILADIKPYIQPFERTLALMELEHLTNAVPTPQNGNVDSATTFVVETDTLPEQILASVAYWEQIRTPTARVSTQVLREATSNLVRNGIPLQQIERELPFRSNADLRKPTRRILRYGTHGIHEYRGKFFPQLVRALINIADVPSGGLVADPMCGSGTTPVEAILSGRVGLGIDLNPLSVLMSRTKCALLSEKPATIASEYERVRAELLTDTRSSNPPLRYFQSLPAADQQYLLKWFPKEVLCDLDCIVCTIHTVESQATRGMMLVSLSNILRRVSWQREADLRVRREVTLDVETDAVREFLEELGRTVRIVLAFLYQSQSDSIGSFDVGEADARLMQHTWGAYLAQVDAVITSPPYATALPYLDTDRLSLIYLKLLERQQLRSRDVQMIGNREVTKGKREDYWKRFCDAKTTIPADIVQLVERIRGLNEATNVGFRRRNLPSLLAKYFLDMRTVLGGIGVLLKPGGKAFFIVGNNHTKAGGIHVDIPTASLLGVLGKHVGLDLVDRIPMEMLHSRDIFKKNAIASEDILIFQRPL